MPDTTPTLEERIAELRREEAVLRQGGGPQAVARQHAKRRLGVRERLARLLDDEGSFLELGLWAACNGLAFAIGPTLGGLLIGRFGWRGIFLAVQYSLEIPGVATYNFLRVALNAHRKKRGESELLMPEFLKRLHELAGKLGIDREMLRRPVNVGFSGGEKKRNEILQMALLEPRLAVLDETDSGLDIDALKVVAEGVNRLRSPERAFVVITHYQRLLDHIVPDIVHVLSRGRIVRTGGKELAIELEARGYAQYQEEMA